MRNSFISAVLLGFAIAGASASETSVWVREGAVKAITPAGVAQAAAGQKVILAAQAGPVATVDNPLVARVLELDKLVQAEIAGGNLKIDGTMVQAVRFNSEQQGEAAVLSEDKNRDSQPSTTSRINNMLISADLKFYSMDGKLLTYDVKKRNEKEGMVTVHFPQAVPPGGAFKYISVSTFVPEAPIFSHKGDVWRVWSSNASRNYLNYYVFVLPTSAILLNTNRKPLMVSSEEGRIAVTFRNFTGEEARDGMSAFFLWPEKDGTSVESLLSNLEFEGESGTVLDWLKRDK